MPHLLHPPRRPCRDYTGGTKVTRIVGFCSEAMCTPGLLSGPFEETLDDYKGIADSLITAPYSLYFLHHSTRHTGMEISYSGYTGVDFQLGNEYITITAATTVPILMEVN